MFEPLVFINKLCGLGTRQGAAARQAGELIKNILREHSVSFETERFQAEIPAVQKAELFADGERVACEACCFTSGYLTGKDALASSLIPSRHLIDVPNINFNPRCVSISRSNFYFAPSVAVAAKDVPKILSAKEVRGAVAVEKTLEDAEHILVGNMENPETLIFAHFDSIGPGGTDNASGVAACLAALLRDPEARKDTLYVFDGNEELSYDKPTYWGRGFRVFEEAHADLLEGARKIYVTDCVGNGALEVVSDERIVNLAFPIRGYEKWKRKIFIVSADIHKLLSVYHSAGDTPAELSAAYLEEAVAFLATSKNRD